MNYQIIIESIVLTLILMSLIFICIMLLIETLYARRRLKEMGEGLYEFRAELKKQFPKEYKEVFRK